jgi:RNA polymerase sigma-70 factor, ECF subfamily
VVQESFLRAFRQIQSFDGRSAFGTWLYRIAANCSLDLLRARKIREDRRVSPTEEESFGWLENVATSAPSPERLTQSGQIASLLRPALAQLSDMERTAFILRHYEGCDIDQISQVLGVKANAAKHTVFRAVQKLRRALEPVLGVAQ